MFDALLADGLASAAGEKVATFVVKCLAVGGGFLVGYFLGGVIAWALDRWVFAQKAPDQLKKAVSLVAAIALALLVALIVFGEGGNGLFGRGGTGDGKGTPTPDDNKGKVAPVPPEQKKDETPPKKDETPKAPVTPMPGDVRITILSSGEARDARYYLIEGDPAPKNLEELQQVILTRKKDAKPELKQVIFRFKKDEYPVDAPIVKDVVTWLYSVKIGVTFE
jgi:hypothetical protein